MANNTTDHLLNSTQPTLSLACPFMGDFAWQQEYLMPTTFVMLVVVVCVEVPMCLVTTLLNVLVILAVWCKRYLRKQKSCVLLACLAVTDLIVGAVVLPLTIISHIMRLIGRGPVCLVDFVATGSSFLACAASLFHLVIISGERYVAIKHALRYETLVTTRRLTIAVTVAWAIAVVLTIAKNIQADNALRNQVTILIVVVCVPVSVAVISFFQVALLFESRRHRKHIRAHQVSETEAREILKEDKAARTTTMIVGALCVCYALPSAYHVAIFIGEYLSKSLALGSLYLVRLLVYFNSLINPVIYCMRTRVVERAFREFLNLGNPQVNPELEMHRARNFARQQRNSKHGVGPSHNDKRTTWVELTSPRVSRTRSLDLSTDSSQLQRTRRNNSIL